MRTGLERHVHGRPRRIRVPSAAVLKSRPLRVQATKLRVKPLANDLTLPNYNSPDKRIGTDPPTPTLRKLQRPREMAPIRACELRIHRTD
jgi:hypothetical protein